MQRAFRCLAPRVQCHALHPRKTHRPSVRSWRGPRRGKEGERKRERTDVHRYRVTGSGTIRPRSSSSRRRKSRIRTPNTDAVDRDSGRASSRLIERSTEEKNVTRWYATTVTATVTTCADATMKRRRTSLSVNDTQGGVNDGIARWRRRQRLMKGAGTLTSEEERTRDPDGRPRLSALPANIFSSYAHNRDIWPR